MSEIDKRNILAGEIFSYRASKQNKVFIYWRGQQVKILKGTEAQKFIGDVAGLEHQEAQLVMAKVTGNFKRGNEHNSKKS